MFLTMYLFCSSASEDLGCRRGDFSRKHYGSVELVSSIHTALICLLLSLLSQHDCLLIGFLLILLTDSSHHLCSLSVSLSLSLPLIAFPSLLLAWMKNRGGLMSHDVLGVVQRCALPAWISMAALVTMMQESKVHLVLFGGCWCRSVSLWLITKLLSHCCFRGVCMGCMSFQCEPCLYILIVHRDRKSWCFARQSYFLPETCCGSVHECCAPRK